MTQPYDRDEPTAANERMWPLDVAIAALTGLILYLVLTVLTFDDTRWQYNATTYLIAVPTIAAAIALAMRQFASRYLQKSAQLGFLFSTFVHLLLLIVAFRWMIFPHYFPEAFAGVKQHRAPVRKTVSEHLFQTPSQDTEQPDWSKPVEAETTTRVEPEQERQIPKVDRSAPKVELPKIDDSPQPQPKPSLTRRRETSQSEPIPADTPAQLSRRTTEPPRPTPNSSPEAPSVATASTARAEPASAERSTSVSRTATGTEMTSPSPANSTPTFRPSTAVSNAAASASRVLNDAMPTFGEPLIAESRRSRARPRPSTPAASAPPPSVSIARVDDSANRMLAPSDTPLARTTTNAGAVTAPAASARAMASMLPDTGSSAAGARYERNETPAVIGLPGLPDAANVATPRPTGRRRSKLPGMGSAAAGPPAPTMAANAGEQSTSGSPSPGDFSMQSRATDLMPTRRASSGSAGPSAPTESAPSGLSADNQLTPGPAGISILPNPSMGLFPSDETPRIASLDLNTGRRIKRRSGSPITPAGSVVASVETFDRRIQRTQGGAAPAPSGMVGPATEEAIERGLAFLADSQNEDGSWSLQGHGEDVAFRSDSAATGLCLLAFQGAGYTHRQHQYADTVAKGIDFLVRNQDPSGSLYRRENRMSDQNVAFYSHGIAALAMCEAYGMTRDEEIRGSAQAAINFIALTQHRKYGGWRYAPQVSSDTSVSGWMMMALKSGELSGLDVPQETYDGILRWLEFAQQGPQNQDRYRYNPFAPNTPSQRHGRLPTPTMTAVGMLMRMYTGWRRDNPAMQSAADYLLEYPPEIGSSLSPQRDTYYWYYATQVMFHMGGKHWEQWNQKLNPILIDGQVKEGPRAGSWDPNLPVPDRWSQHGGRVYVTATNLLNLEVYYRHLPIYEDTAE